MALTRDKEIVQRTSSDTLVAQLQDVVMAPGRYKLDPLMSAVATLTPVTKGDLHEVMQMHHMLLAARTAVAELLERAAIVGRKTTLKPDEDNGPST